MKVTLALLAVAGTAMASAISDLPQCGQTCINNMISIANTAFGCAVDDVACYCSNENFGYGVRDCSNEACGSDDAVKAIQYGTDYCKSVFASAGVTGAVSTGALPILTSALAEVSATTTGDVASSIASATGSAGSLITSVASSVNSAASSVASSVASDASSVASSVASDASSIAKSLESGASSLITSIASDASSRAASASSKASSVAEKVSSALSSIASEATDGSTAGAAPMATAGPMLGAAALAALYFI